MTINPKKNYLSGKSLEKETSKYTPTELKTIRELLLNPYIFSPDLGFKVFHGSIIEIIQNLRVKGIIICTKREHTKKAHGRRIAKYKIANESAVYCGLLVGLNIMLNNNEYCELNMWHLSALDCLIKSNNYTIDILKSDVITHKTTANIESVLSDLKKFGYEIIRTPRQNKSHEGIKLHHNSRAKALLAIGIDPKTGESIENN